MNKIKKVITLFVLIGCSHFMYGQTASTETTNDPLSKPEIWSKLEENPYSDDLWSKYFGMDLFTLSKEDYINYNTWKAKLVAVKNAKNEERELELMKKREEYIAKRYNRKLNESDFEELSQNVHKNFDIIEQYFSEQYELYGEKYKTYEETHPDKKYNKMKWVEENEEALINFQLN
ncbi:hypothetical protein [Flexithrix dorotheae]|uniref:hypothetical protein n=1 Tax=Flexithrix dorotheae TaxID=70993 RepID=UPI0012FBD9EA|nr:hypothetical protein [Flexithrix dorotheae]